MLPPPNPTSLSPVVHLAYGISPMPPPPYPGPCPPTLPPPPTPPRIASSHRHTRTGRIPGQLGTHRREDWDGKFNGNSRLLHGVDLGDLFCGVRRAGLHLGGGELHRLDIARLLSCILFAIVDVAKHPQGTQGLPSMPPGGNGGPKNQPPTHPRPHAPTNAAGGGRRETGPTRQGGKAPGQGPGGSKHKPQTAPGPQQREGPRDPGPEARGPGTRSADGAQKLKGHGNRAPHLEGPKGLGWGGRGGAGPGGVAHRGEGGTGARGFRLSWAFPPPQLSQFLTIPSNQLIWFFEY